MDDKPKRPLRTLAEEKNLLQTVIENYQLTKPFSGSQLKSQDFASRKKVFEFVESAFRNQSALLESIVDNTSAVIYVKDLEGRYLLINRAYEEYFSLDRREMAGKTDMDIFPKEIAEHFRRNDLKVLQSGKALEFEEAVMQDGTMHTYISSKFPIFDSEGKAFAVAGISTDISDRKHYEDTLAASTEYLNQIINSVADPIFVKDREHRWVLLNDACCRFIGHTREELMGKSDHEFFSKSEADIFWKKDEEVFTSKKENLNEENFTDAKGELHTIVTKKTLYTDHKGEQFIVGVIRDITEQKKAEIALLTKTLELAQASAEREYLELFAYVASHDLQEPLQKIIAFGGLLKTNQNSELDEKGRNYIEKMQMAAMRMSRMIEDLLRFTKATMGADLFQGVDLEVTLGEVLSDLDLKISQCKAKIKIESLPVVFGDRRQMHQLFLNLLTNALKFQSKERHPHITVRSAACKEKGFIEIQVEDNGIGFENSEAERIFRPFERINSRNDYEGSGIGLAICKRIVTRHGGRIAVRSTPGKGSIFSVTLPLHQENK